MWAASTGFRIGLVMPLTMVAMKLFPRSHWTDVQVDALEFKYIFKTTLWYTAKSRGQGRERRSKKDGANNHWSC